MKTFSHPKRLGAALLSAGLSSALVSPPLHALTLQEAYTLKGSGKVATELLLQASGAPKGAVTVSALARPGQADRLLADLNALGLEHGAAAGRLVTGRLPWSAVHALDALAALHSVRPSQALFQAADSTSVGSYVPTNPGTFGPQGAIVSQGDKEMYAKAARTRFGVDGTGVKVGVLSDSYGCSTNPFSGVATTLQTGDIPQGVQILSDPCLISLLGARGWNDEGRTMVEVIHDLAPGASLAFHTAANGAADMAAGIRALADAGATVIVDDTVYLDEPVYQDGGPIADAVREVVGRGVAYVAAAGNFGRNTYEAPFRPSGTTITIPAQVKEWGPVHVWDPQTRITKLSGMQRVSTPARTVELHDFDSGPGVDTCQRITLPYNWKIALALHWDQPYASIGGGPGAASDLDLFLMDENCQQVYQAPTPLGTAAGLNASLFGVAATDNLGGDPVETLLAIGPNNTGGPTVSGDFAFRTYGVAVGRVAGPAPGRIRITYAAGATHDDPGVYAINFLELLGQAPQAPEYTPEDSPGIFGHANLPDVVTVGAVRAKALRNLKRYPNGRAYWGTAPGEVMDTSFHQTEPYSALGGTPLLFDEHGQPLAQPVPRRKPDIAGVDGTEHIFTIDWARISGVGDWFFGTSAAAAHVGGLVALARQAAPAATPGQIAEALRATAIDLDDTLTPGVATGFDFATGHGLADGENLIAKLLAQPDAPRAGGGGAAATDCYLPTATAQPGVVLRGTPGNDVLVGSDAGDRLVGLRGNDTLCGGPGNDRLLGGPGNDVLIGGPGNDLLKGGPGKDLFRFAGNTATGRDRILDFGPGDVIEIAGRPDANGDGRVDGADVLVRDTASGAVLTGVRPAPGEAILVRGRTAAEVRKALRVLP